MLAAKKLKRAERVDPPYALSDAASHIDFIMFMMNEKPGSRPETLYGWAGTHEDARLWWQNNFELGDQTVESWGEGHFNYCVHLREQGVDPKHIATIGIGQDASLVENLAVVFPEADITIIEQNC